jgi:hypothetical protein
MPKLRQKLQKWIYRGLLEKIGVVCKRNGVQLIKVNPAYTSVIGKIKYAPIYRIDKDIAGAYVIARRGLGFKESLPKNYRKLLEDKEFCLTRWQGLRIGLLSLRRRWKRRKTNTREIS